MNTTTTLQNPNFVTKHPKGLYILFFTELWERFSYYGMRAILVLYLVSEAADGPKGGLGWTNAEALALYGWYTMLVYLASVPGGWIADRYTGQRKAVMIGGLLLCLGHGVMAIPNTTAFYAALTLIIMGVGMLKPNISTLVGSLYAPGDPMRDKGFTFFYIGINIGALLAAFAVGTVGELVGWHYGFALAGIGMAVGQFFYIKGQKHLKGVGELATEVNKATGKKEVIHTPLTKVEKDRMKVIFLSFFIVIVFWGAFEQAGGLMNIFANDKTDRFLLGWEIPTSWFQSLNPFFIMIFGTAVASFWIWWRKKGKEDSSLYKMAIGTMIMGTGFVFMIVASVQASSDGQAAMVWLILAYLFHTIGELCSSPVALSFITKLAPVKYASIMMGTYFAVTGLGNRVAGWLGEAAFSGGDASEKTVFITITVFTVVFGAVVLLFLKPLKRLTHHAEDDHPEDKTGHTDLDAANQDDVKKNVA
jgi:proton-dependent oligopeptide transporter, POT family